MLYNICVIIESSCRNTSCCNYTITLVVMEIITVTLLYYYWPSLHEPMDLSPIIMYKDTPLGTSSSHVNDVTIIILLEYLTKSCYYNYTTRIHYCNCLIPYFLFAIGLGGSPCILDIGGVPYLMPVPDRSKVNIHNYIHVIYRRYIILYTCIMYL